MGKVLPLKLVSKTESSGEALILKLWGVSSTSSLPLLSGPLWPEVAVFLGSYKIQYVGMTLEPSLVFNWFLGGFSVQY